jgi:hypothetical protein
LKIYRNSKVQRFKVQKFRVKIDELRVLKSSEPTKRRIYEKTCIDDYRAGTHCAGSLGMVRNTSKRGKPDYQRR